MFNESNLNGYAISTKLMKWLLDNLPRQSTILELGSGTGTIELCKYYKVYSIENDKNWLNIACKSTYIYAPLKRYRSDRPNIKPYEWFDIDRVKKGIPETYDCLLIDAPKGKGRSAILDFMDIFPSWEVPIIIDDTHREEELKLALEIANRLKKALFQYADTEKSFCVIE